MGDKDCTVKKLLLKCENERCYVSCNLPSLPRNKTHKTKQPSTIRSQDGVYSWLVCFNATLSLVIALGLPSSFGVLFPALLEDFKESKAKTAWVGSLNMSLPFLLGPVAAILCNRYGCRATIIFGALVTVFGLLVTSQVPSILVMYFTYGVVCSFGACCVYTGCFIIAPRYFNKRRSLATSLLTTGYSLATLTFGPLLQILIECMGWRRSFFVLAAVNSFVCVLALSFHPDVDDADVRERAKLTYTSTKNLKTGHRLQWEVMKNKKFIFYCATSVLIFLGYYNALVYIVQFAMQKGIPSSKSSMLYFYFGLTSTLSRILAGIILNFNVIDVPLLCIAALFINGVSVLSLALTNSFVELLIIFLVLGLTEGASACSMILLVLHCVKPSEAAFAFGLWLFCAAFSMILGPVSSGLIVDAFQSYNPVFFVSGGVLLLSTVILALSFLPCARTKYESAKQQLNLSLLEEYTIIERVSVV